MCLIKIKNSGSFQRVKERLKLILLKKLTEQKEILIKSNLAILTMFSNVQCADEDFTVSEYISI